MTRNVRFLVLGTLVAVVATITTQLWAQSTTSTPVPAATPAAETVIQQIVEVTTGVAAGTAPVTAYTVPAGSRLVVTDVLVTNPGAAPTCALSLARGAQPVMGPLCVPATTTVTLSLTTGMEFASGDTVQLVRPPATGAAAGAEPGGAATVADTISVHVRGFLVAG